MDANEFQDDSSNDLVLELVKQFEAAVKEQQQVFLEEENYEQIVEFYMEAREFKNALLAIENALEQYSFSSFFYTKKAEIFANQKHFSEALIVLEEAQRLDPTDINIFLIRADVYLWEGKHELALEEVAYAMTIAQDAGDKCELYLELADIWEDQEKYFEVMEALKDAIRQDPKNEEGLNRLWFCTELTEKYEESIKFHEELVELSPYSYMAWFNLGHAYAGLGNNEKALDAFEYVMAIEDNFEAAYICYGDVKYNLEQYDEALNFYMEAIKLSKPNKEIYLKVAETYEKLGDMSKSRSFLRKAISVDPYYDEAFFRIGETYRQEEKWTKAISSFERAVKLSKENTDYLTALAEAYMSIDEGDKAMEIFERIFQIDPQSKQNWINLATAYFNVENYRKAFQVLNEAELKYENSADIFYIKSVFYFQAGNRHEALLNLERGLLTNFNEHTIIFEMDDSLLDDPAVLQVIEQYRD